MRHRRNIIPSPASSSDGRPMCAAIVTATIVVMTSPRLAHFRNGSLMLSDFLRRLSGSLFSLAVVTARRATQILQNSAPGL
jgi:hypothetical protein